MTITVTHLFLVANREIKERRALFLVALVFGLMPFLSLLVPDLRSVGLKQSSDVVNLSTMLLAMVFAAGASLVVGGTVIGRDLAEQRLSFYFARPIPSFAIWGGKFFGGLTLIYLSIFLLLLPTTLIVGLGKDFYKWETVLQLGGGVLALFSAGLVLGIIFRSKSLWLAVDLASIPIVALLAFPGVQRLLNVGAIPSLNMCLIFFLAIMVLSLICASAASVIVGRTDVKRAHSALSKTFWTGILISVLLFEAYSHWALASTPEDFMYFYLVGSSPSNNWLVVSGESRRAPGYYPNFLVNTKSNQFYNIGIGFYDALAFSPDGNRFAWLSFQGRPADSTLDLYTITLDLANPEPKHTNLSFTQENGRQLVLSQDGSRIAVFGKNLISIFELPTEKELATVALTGLAQLDPMKNSQVIAFFISPDRIRFYRSIKSALEIVEVDIVNKKLEVTGKINFPYKSFLVNNSGEYVLITNNIEGNETINSIRLFNGRSGEMITTLVTDKSTADGSTIKYGTPSFLSDGRIIVTQQQNNNVELMIFLPTGILEKTIALGKGHSTGLATELTAGQIILMLHTDSTRTYNNPNDPILLIDIANGKVSEKAKGLRPAVPFYWFYGHHTPAPGESAKFYYQHDKKDKLIHYDPISGEQHTVLTARPSVIF
ncbi:MAG: WD40 repeat domain-containing protein [Acidobacteriota bacterium]